MFIDTHCHLFFKEFDEDRAMVIGNAKKAGVKKFIIPGVDAYSSKQAVDLANHNSGIIFAAVGFHPYEASHNPDSATLPYLINKVTNKRSNEASPIVAIGEIGLDYHQYGNEKAAGKKDQQKRLFEEQLLLTLKHNLPVIMHCRDAFIDFFSILDSLPLIPSGVIHCFSGGLQDLRMAKDRHLFVGVDGNITYSKHLQSIISSIPLSMLLLETDAPYLTPTPHRGSRNEPKYLPLIAKTVAELTHESIQTIEEQTTQNAQNLFSC